MTPRQNNTKHPADEPRPGDEDADSTDASTPEEASEKPEADPRARESSDPAAIVAIGASAGGLEALQQFFSKMPVDSGLGFVVITHVHPDRRSMLPELLANVTEIPVSAGEETMRVEADRIIVAKDSLLEINNGRLHPIKADDDPEVSHHPIDYFFRALAEDQARRGICIVLSGSGSDGAIGLRAIKAAGGMAMVQAPDSAKYRSMPDAAKSTELADYILPAPDLPAALVDYCRRPFVRATREAGEPGLSDDQIHAVLVRLRAQTGQDFTCYKTSTMARRIERRMSVHRIDNPSDYARFLRENPEEVRLLLRELLISVTSFFRDPEAFEALADRGIPDLLDRQDDGDTLRVWVPGCATGEEAYATAILLHEQIENRNRLVDVQIFATDLDDSAIETARAGFYPEGIRADMTRERLDRYFSRDGDGYRIHKNIRDMVVFAVQNVISDPPFTRMDMIVCRNLLIYLNAEAQQQVLANFHYSLVSGGLLFLGSSETPGEATDLFESVDSKHKILRRKEGPRQVRPGAGLGPAPATREDQETEEFPAARARRGQHLRRGVERLLLERYAPCSVVVDAGDTVIYVHGRSGMYLEPEQGAPRNNVLEMAREGLRSPLRAALSRARNEKREIARPRLRVKTNGESAWVDLTVRPLPGPAAPGAVLVTLEESRGDGQEPAETPTAPHSDEERDDLERELRYTRENLQSTIEEMETSNEELKSSNEELQSTNEELQSSNEELETSKEEMQSLNEELNTVNAELQSKVEALARANDDMANLLNSMQVATVFLDSDLRVKRYTERARDVFRLIESDVGRPLSDLTTSLRYDDLVADCRAVLESLAPREREVQDETDRWYMVRLLPYRTSENVIDGLVMTVTDIDRIKRAEASEARAVLSRDFFRGIVQTLREPLLVLRRDLRVANANDAFHRTFRTRADETDGREVYELGNGQWDIPELRSLLEDVLPAGNAMTDFRVEHDFPWIGRRSFTLNARKLPLDDGESDLILLAFEDVTESEE